MNGRNGKLVGIISTIVFIIVTFVGYIVANDLMSRSRDTVIADACDTEMDRHKEVAEARLSDIVKGQTVQSIQLGKIETTLDFIKDRVK